MKLRPEKPEPSWILKLLAAMAHYYYAFMFVWAVLHWVAGDRWWWLFLFNVFAKYLFLPLPLILILVLLIRRRDVTLGFVAVLLLGCLLYGRLMLPPIRLNRSSGPQITVMSSNVYGYNTGADEVVDSIRAADADVVAIQELNLPVAEAIRQDLSIIYPYQALSPDTSVRGLGVISRYPLQPVMVDLEGDWVGEPQVLEMTWQGESITLVNFHAIPPGRIKPSNLNYTIAERERQLANLVQFVERQGGPVIALGDLNAAEQNAVYRMMRGVFRDAWAGGGWGFGHTYPGDPAYGSEGLQILGIWVPMWLLRLDYVFHSPEWQVDSAWIGPWSGVSDHRPVVARLVLRR